MYHLHIFCSRQKVWFHSVCQFATGYLQCRTPQWRNRRKIESNFTMVTTNNHMTHHSCNNSITLRAILKIVYQIHITQKFSHHTWFPISISMFYVSDLQFPRLRAGLFNWRSAGHSRPPSTAVTCHIKDPDNITRSGSHTLGGSTGGQSPGPGSPLKVEGGFRTPHSTWTGDPVSLWPRKPVCGLAPGHWSLCFLGPVLVIF